MDKQCIDNLLQFDHEVAMLRITLQTLCPGKLFVLRRYDDVMGWFRKIILDELDEL